MVESEDTGIYQIPKMYMHHNPLLYVRKWSEEKILQGQGILFWVREKGHFEEKSGKKIEIIKHGWFNTIDRWKKNLGSLGSPQKF